MVITLKSLKGSRRSYRSKYKRIYLSEIGLGHFAGANDQNKDTMSTSKANAHWKGTIKEGNGTMRFTGYEGAYTFASRFESGTGTNPEELVGAAHAGCYSMYLSLLLTEAGLTPKSINTSASVTIAKDDSGPHITEIALDCKVECEGLDEAKLKELAATTKEKCPISRLYAGGTAKITASATLVK